jgi:hypothetical protein
MSQRHLVVVLGMHRSGTSVITSLVESCGASAGNNIQNAGDDNPKGYWEDEFIVNTNNALLHSLGLAWHSLVWLPLDKIQTSSQFERLFADSVKYLQSLTEQYDTLVIKDPRMAITLSFWLSVFAQLNIHVDYIIAKRSPSAIGQSLITRDGFDHEYAAQLIYLHWASICHFLPADALFLVVHYEQVKRSETQVRQSICEFLQLLPVASQQTFFDERLDHHGSSKNEVGFCWQRNFFETFPHAEADVIQINALQTYYAALSRGYLQSHLQRSVVKEIFTIADKLNGQKIVLYGASQLTSIMIGPLANIIVLAIDEAATPTHPVHRYGMKFQPVERLETSEYDCVLVGVVGRKSQITSTLQTMTDHPVYFLEDWLFAE